MITQGVRVRDRCDVCGGTVVVDVGQFFEGGVLSWGSEGHCEDCSHGWCEQDSGPVTPEDIRQALLQAHGAVRLRLSGQTPRVVGVLRALRGARELSLAAARAQAAQLAGDGLVGTLVEMEILAVHLRRRNIAVGIEPVV
ncbi:hypothetical protein ACWDXD_31860 [Streptomyces sp. NPDC003314]|uniref:hypothetical protein n=1 Tax=Streptomyces sp. NPDC090093 TaxID=3365945 RepID=UPI00382ECB40